MSITGSASIRRLKDVAIVMDLHELGPVGGLRWHGVGEGHMESGVRVTSPSAR